MRRRIVASMTIVVVVAVLLFALPLALDLKHRERDQDRRELTQLAALTATRVDARRLGAPLPVHHAESDQRVGLYDRAGHRIDGTGPAELEPAVRSALSDRIVETSTAANLLTVVPVVDRSGVQGAVRVSEPLSSGRARLYLQWLRLAVIGVLAVVVAALAAVALARRLVRPLAGLVDDATRIGDGDFTLTARGTGLPEVDQVAAALTNTAGRLSDLVAREKAFSADASHQLRSPLAALRVTVESELSHPRPDPTEALRQALGDIDRLEQTIDELLALARETSPERAPIDLAATLDKLCQRWEAALAAQRRRLVSERRAAIPPVRVSDAAISHVLDVLVANAQHHGAGDVVIEARPHHGAVSVTVSDHGGGVAHPEHLFVRRQPGARGNGIGLALAQRLAEAEGGRLVLKQNGPPVTTFELTLPER